MKTTLLAWRLLAALLALAGVASAQAARLALVIGNNSYRQIEPLHNAINDARLIAATLKEAGFEVERVHEDLGQKAMLRAINGFKARITKADDVVFFYAGHGVQMGQQSPVLLPIDITQENADQIVQDGVQLFTVQEALKNAKFALLVIDACRINPFPPKADGTRGMIRETGLMLPQPAVGSMVIMSAANGQKALDYVPGGTRSNGLFTHEFVQIIKTPGLILNMAALDVRDRVEALAQRAGNLQRPAFLDESGGRFVFFAAPAPVVAPVVAPAVARPTVRLATEQEIEQDLWNVIRDSHDAQDFKDYIKSYPAGRFLQLAQRQLRVLTAAPPVQLASIQPEPVQPVVPPQAPQAATAPAPRPAAPAPLACAGCPEMVVIPAGSFQMGSNDGDEKPPHRVSIKSFALGKYEVTQGQWKAVMGSNPSRFTSCGDNCPVEQVSWNDIQQYIQKLNQQTGQNYRLPSEAEWEYAARAGTSSKYWWGDNIGNNNANCDGCGSQWDNKTTAPVGSFKPNAFGLYDMHGNVWEWAQDWYHDNYSGAPSDGSAWESGGEQRYRVLRGGSWISVPAVLRSAFRSRSSPVNRNIGYGFRLARTLLTP